MGRILIKGGVWRNTEDEILKAAVMKYGKNQWSRIASLLHRKSAKQCKARWFEWLDPSIKKTEWSREEEEKLINLVRLMPTQWRTIASIVGRTASQCLEHYEQLLDQVQNKDKDGAIDDPRKLKPGEIDPNPETKPARPDPKDMDEDELEMLSEARARLANTQGKKAKRKAREKQLEEARRLASLQKRRELRMAGINMQIRNHKFKRYIDYNNEVPFEKPVPAGFHDTTNDVYDPAGHDFKRLRQQQLDGELPSEREERERKKDKQKLKQKKENGMPTSLLNQNEIIKPRSKLVLPEPAISENEIEQVVKLGKVSELAKETAAESGTVASGTLLADYTINTSINNIRTPKNPILSRDNILMEAQNLIALTNVDTPLKGGTNVPLVDVPDISTPAGLAATMTPNTMIATPFRSAHGKTVGGTPARTPGTMGTQEGFTTPLSTPLRDKLAINPEDSLAFDSASDSKRHNKEMKENLRKAFADLPAPKNEYEIVLNNKQEDEEDDKEAVDVEMVDQSEVDAKIQKQQKEKLMKEQKWSQAVQRDAPRPTDVRNTLLTSSTTGSLLAQAEDLIKEEMIKILHFDALVNPTENQQTFAALCSKSSANNSQTPKTYESLLAGYLQKNPIEPVADKDLAKARKLLEQEMKVVKEGMEHEDLSLADYSQVWDECYSQLLYVPSQNKYTKAKIVYKNEHIRALESRLEQNRVHMSKEAKKAAKLEKKISILLGGYQSRAVEMHKQIRENVKDIEQARLELYSFNALKVCEDRAITKRIGLLEEDVRKQNEREKLLQTRYNELISRKEELLEELQPANCEKVNEFLREIAPMRETQFWHDFISRLLDGTQSEPVSPTFGRHYPQPAKFTSTLQPAGEWSAQPVRPMFASPPPVPPSKPKIFKPSTIAVNSDSSSRINNNNRQLISRLVAPPPIMSEQEYSVSTTTTVTESVKNSASATVNDDESKSEMVSAKVEKNLEVVDCKPPNGTKSPNASPLERSLSMPSESNLPPSPLPGTKPTTVDDQALISLTKKPLFTSSSFYDPHSHPTIEEQVRLCREIAKQLVCDVSNAKSKGREMFERRVEKSSQWITENEDSFQNYSNTEEDYHERTISDDPPNLKLLLDPRHVKDINTVQGVNEHIIVTREKETQNTCRDIVQELKSPEVNPNRGNQLFAKRVQKSDQWIVDDVAEQVIDAARDKLFRNVKSTPPRDSHSLAPAYGRYSMSPIAGPIFSPVLGAQEPRPHSALAATGQFRDFNARAKPFCRAY